MPDPQVLYVVTAVVVLALVAWVIAVLTRTGTAAESSKSALVPAGGPPADAREASDDAPSSKTIPAEPPAKSNRPPSAPAPATPSIGSTTTEVHIDVEEDEEPTGPHALILVTAVGRTDPGLKRKHNEDAYTILENHHLFVIADGMGRHAAGEIASKMCVDAITESFEKGTKPQYKPEGAIPKRGAQLRDGIQLANEKIFDESHEVDEYAGMGTTVVTAYFSPNNQRVYIGHVGDSRCYRFRDGQLTQITKDHTLGAAGIQGKSSNVLSRAVGIEDHVEVDLNIESPASRRHLSPLFGRPVAHGRRRADLKTVGEVKDLDACVAKLIEMANARGGRDNITAILIGVEDAPRSSSAPPRR